MDTIITLDRSYISNHFSSLDDFKRELKKTSRMYCGFYTSDDPKWKSRVRLHIDTGDLTEVTAFLASRNIV